MSYKMFVAVFATSAVCFAQAPSAIRAQSASSFSLTEKEGSAVFEITNASYQVTAAFIPGRPKEQRLVLRKTTRLKQVMDEMGSQATTTLEAWPLGEDIKQKPLYSLTVSGNDGRVVDGSLFEVSRGLEEVEWWSVYQVGTGKHLFDSYVPLTSFSLSREVLTRRYVGLEVPPDDAKDARLKDPHVVGVLSYASAEKVIREVMITCDDLQRARLYRSYFDMGRTLSVSERLTIQLTFRESYPSKNAAVLFEFPVKGDDIDLVRSKLPPGFRAAVWKR